MIGAGVFAAFAPAAAAAGSGLLVGLALAAAVAYCNAVASAQLAAAVPDLGRHVRLRPRAARRVVGLPRRLGLRDRQDRLVRGHGAHLRGLRAAGPGWLQRASARPPWSALTAGQLSRRSPAPPAGARARLLARSSPSRSSASSPLAAVRPVQPTLAAWARRRAALYGVLQSAGLLFFAFAGYARIATLGEEVREPARTIPRAIPLALGIAVVVYAAVGASALAVLGPSAPGRRGARRSPPRSTRRARPGRGRSSASGRPSPASGRCSRSSPASAAPRSPWPATATCRDSLASSTPLSGAATTPSWRSRAVVVLLVALTDLRGAIGFSSFGVLLYYSIANAAAFTQRPPHRRWPRAPERRGRAGAWWRAARRQSRAAEPRHVRGGAGRLVLASASAWPSPPAEHIGS